MSTIRSMAMESSPGRVGTDTLVITTTTSDKATARWSGQMAALIRATGSKASNMESVS